MMQKFIHKSLLIVLFCNCLEAMADEDIKKGEVNHLELATMMYYDGNYKKASKELSLVNSSDEKFDAAKYFSLKGLVAMKEEHYDEAIENLKRAIEETKAKVFVDPNAIKEKKVKHVFLIDLMKKKKKKSNFDPEKIREQKLEQLHLFLSRIYYKKKDYLNAILELEHAGKAGQERPELFLYKADCYWKLEDHSNAMKTLDEAMSKFPDNKMVVKQKFFYLTSLKLYHVAIKLAKKSLLNEESSAKEYLAIAQVFYRAGENKKAIEILEDAKTIFDDEPKISLLLGNIYLKEQMLHIPAFLFEQSADIDPKYTKDAVEMYRRAGEIGHAIYLNSKNPDPIDQIKQKVAIMVSRGDFEKLIGLKDDLSRYGLLDSDPIKYALAYAYYYVKDYDNAEKYLKKITDNKLFSKATIMRKNIEKCKEKPLECL